MEEKRNHKGLKKYETLLQAVCRTEDYSQLNENEWEGCLGIACVMSVIEGVTPNMFSLSKHLDIPHYNVHLQHAFERLKVNGVLSNRFAVRTDPSLTGNAADNKWQSAAEVERNAWCMIAGVASGCMGMGEQEKREGADEKVEETLPALTLGE